MFWSRSRRPAPSGARLRLDPLLEDRCVPCSGCESPAAVTAAQVATVAPPVAAAVVADPTPTVAATGPARSAVTAAPPVSTPAVQTVTIAVSQVADDSPAEKDPFLTAG